MTISVDVSQQLIIVEMTGMGSLQHNTLSGAQGGNVSERYHLSVDDYTNVIDQIWVNKSGDIMSGDLIMSGNALQSVGCVDFSLSTIIPAAEGRLRWDDDTGSLVLGLKGGVVNLNLGQEQVFRGKNLTGSNETDGRPVRISGASGANPELGFSEADILSLAECIGLYTEDVGTNSNGYVTTFGLVRNMDTSGAAVSEVWSANTRLFVSDTPGELTSILPSGISRKIFVGIVLRAHATEGIILVHPINIFYLQELSGMSIDEPADGDQVTYDAATGTWTNVAPGDGLLDPRYVTV